MRNKLRRPASIALSLSMLALVSAVSVPDVSADETWSKYDNTTLGTSGIHNPTAPTNTTDTWHGDYVYYGKYNGNAVKYRVLDPKCTAYKYDDGSISPYITETDYNKIQSLNTMFLDCDNTLTEGSFNNTNTTYGWQNSKLKQWMNGSNFLTNKDVFSDIERNAIPPVFRKYYTEPINSDYTLISITNHERVFALSLEEVFNSAYGYSTKGTRKKVFVNNSSNNNRWWLRSRVNKEVVENNTTVYKVAMITVDGANYAQPVTSTYGYSPAFNVLQDNIIFASKVNPSNTGTYGNEYKLTLKDLNTTLAVTSVSRSGDTVTVDYTITDETPNDGITLNSTSVLITSDNDIKMYAPLTGENGTGTFTLPADFTDTDNVYILAEDINGQYETDYASEKKSVTIPAEAKISVDEYKSTNTYPTQTGKVFAGWYDDTSYTTPHEGDTGEAYAKFVDADVLSVKVQAAADSQNSDKYIIRIITSIEDLDRQNVSFIVELDGNNAKEYKTRNAYTELTTGLGHDPVTPKELSAESKYLCAINLRVNNDAVTFTITPKWTTADGTVVTGQPKTFNIISA